MICLISFFSYLFQFHKFLVACVLKKNSIQYNNMSTHRTEQEEKKSARTWWNEERQIAKQKT